MRHSAVKLRIQSVIEFRVQSVIEFRIQSIIEFRVQSSEFRNAETNAQLTAGLIHNS